MLTLILLIGVINYVSGSVKCPPTAPPPTGPHKVSESIFEFGDPVMFVTTFSQRYDPYSLVDVHRRTSVLEEYLMVGYTKNHSHSHLQSAEHALEHLRMVVYDGVTNVDPDPTESPNLVHQNLEKEMYWRYYNSTGIFPSMTIINTTKRETVPFHSHRHHANDPSDITFNAFLFTRDLFNEPQIPYVTVFELPANTRVLRKVKTMIEYQSFSLWRWKLSNTIQTWSEINTGSNPLSQLSSSFKRVDNPCIRDLFLLYVPRQSINAADTFVYLASPLIQSHLDENWFYDMKTADHPWWPDAPEKIVLTNDHLVILTLHSMWISDSLNDSRNMDIDLEMNGIFQDRPILTYTQINPCEKFGDGIDCLVSANATMMGNASISTTQRLFYTPVCYLFQFPNYDDYLIFTVERKTTYIDGEEITDFTVLYAPTPYIDWRVLFSNVVYYKVFYQSDEDKMKHITMHVLIQNIVGVFFNHHLRQFDITLELSITKPKYVRFVLPEPTTAFDGYGDILSMLDREKAHASNDRRKKLRQLNGTVGNGFLPFEFPAHFQMESVMVNGDTLDVFFLGNELWIAEGAGPFVYESISGLPELKTKVCSQPGVSTDISNIKDCSFNHPDKAFICTNENQHLLFVGKIGSKFSPSVIRVDEIRELIKAQKVNPWVSDYFCELVRDRSVFVAGYSGRLLFWYLHEPKDQSKALDKAIGSGCAQPDDEPLLCDYVKDWKKDSCKAETLGKTGFRMVAIDASRLKPIKHNTDGPLVPFLLDSSTAVLFEGLVPQAENNDSINYAYFTDVHLGQKIFCMDFELKKVQSRDVTLRYKCELFIRHIKPLDNYLDGFKSSLFVTVVRSIPLLPLPADVVVLAQAQSNMALVKINDYINTPGWEFTEEHIGQTLYIPGNFSILLAGFPIENDTTVMEGYTTMHFQYEQRFAFQAFYIFLFDMSTKKYREVQMSRATERINFTKSRWAETDRENKEKLDAVIETRKRIELRWQESDFAHRNSGVVVPVFKNPPTVKDDREKIETELLEIKKEEITKISQPSPWSPRKLPAPDELVHGLIEYKDRRIWHVLELQCHYVMTLVSNPFLKATGGRISMDIYDRISFEVILRPITSLAKILMYRPMLELTNSNPEVLRVEKVEKLKAAPQYFQILLAPTGFKKGVAVITVRSLVTSVHCAQSSSLTLIILCHRDVGRRLHANYPIPSCKPKESEGMYPRPWYSQIKDCIKSEEILDPTKEEIVREINDRTVTAYITLPINYRPPSFDGADVPNTRNVYNADPSKPAYNTWYKISRDSIDLNRCAGKKTKQECNCNNVDRLLDDEELTECKEKVFSTKRTGTEKPIPMSFSYERIMKDSDQNPEIFLPKRNWTITIEEVNGRGEWYITNDYTPYLKMINSDKRLHRGRRYYDMNKFHVTLLGTGLFHFKAKLGGFESFGDVTGYFMLYARTDDINHVHLFMILLGTIIFCLTMVFIGFLANRKRLSSMLPIQPMSHKRKLKLL